MPISKVGTSNRKDRGFTLIELIVVIMIMGMAAFLVVPRISSFRAGELKQTTRHLSSVIQQLTQDSSATKKRYRLYFNLDSEEYWVMSVAERVRESDQSIFLFENPRGKRIRLPEGILFEDVVTAQKGKVASGEVFSEFYPIGIESMTIHLQEGESHFTLVANPLTGRVKIFDHYLNEAGAG